jgi:hypothetical protein
MRTRRKMMAAVLLIALSGLFFACLPDLLCAQQRGRARTGPEPWAGRYEPPERSQPLVFDNKPFNIALEQLPPFYAAYEPGVLYDKLKKEKQDNAGPSYAIRFTSAERVYNAATRTLSVYCPLINVLDNGKTDGSLRGFAVKYQPLVDNTYTTTNASGEKVEIEEIKFREYVVAFPNFMEFPMEKPAPPDGKQAAEKNRMKDNPAGGQDGGLPPDAITGNVPLTPQEAKQTGERVQVLIIFNPALPYTTQESVEERSTAGRLRDRFAQYYYIHGRLLEVWFYDFETGKVLTKLRPGKALRLG